MSKIEPVAWITKGGDGELWWSQSVDEDGNYNATDVPLYTADALRQARADALEAAAKVCEELTVAFGKGAADYNDGCLECAAAIRARIEKEK